MILMQGKGVSKGIAGGTLCFFRRPDARVRKDAPADPAGERLRLCFRGCEGADRRDHDPDFLQEMRQSCAA